MENGGGGGDCGDDGGSYNGIVIMLFAHENRCRTMQLDGLHTIALLYLHG